MASIHPYSTYMKIAHYVLKVVARDESKKTTFSLLFYNDTSDSEMVVPLGYVNTHVESIIEVDWYRRYREKKFKRIDFLDKHGVMDIRDLEHSDLILKTYRQLESMAGFSAKVNPSLIHMTVKNILQKEKLFFSILGLNFLVTPVSALLDLKHAISKADAKLKKQLPSAEAEEIAVLKAKYESTLQEQLDSQEKNVQILHEYYNIQ
jgi:hypothetical protein